MRNMSFAGYAGRPPATAVLDFSQGVPAARVAASLTVDDTSAVVNNIIPMRFASQLDQALIRGIDFSYSVDGLARFRCSAYSHTGTAACLFRVIPATIPSLEALHLPPVVHNITPRHRGLTLVTGAALIELINGPG